MGRSRALLFFQWVFSRVHRRVTKTGNPVRDAIVNISFSVVSGPGIVWATGNGDPANQVRAEWVDKRREGEGYYNLPSFALVFECFVCLFVCPGAQCCAFTHCLPRPSALHCAHLRRVHHYRGRRSAPRAVEPRSRRWALVRSHWPWWRSRSAA